MNMGAFRALLMAISAAILLFVCITCSRRDYPGSGSRNAPPATPGYSGGKMNLQQQIDDISSYTAPDKVDPLLFDKLKEELARQVAALYLEKLSDIYRRPSGAPTGAAGRVTELAYDAGTNTLSWNYANLGDYDVSGEVGVSDITEIALHYQASTTDGIGNDALEAWIDGDGTHEVGISDITPIAINYQNDVSAYQIYTSDSASGPFTPLGAPVPFNGTGGAPAPPGVKGPSQAGGFPKTFWVVLPGGVLAYLVVAPVGAALDTGTQTVISTTPPGRGDWWMFGRDPTLNRRSPFVGAQAGTLKWRFLASQWGKVFSSPAIGADGTIYVGCGYLVALLDATGLYAVNPDGTLKWKYETGNFVSSSPAIGTDGTIYFGGADAAAVGYLYAVNPDGTLKWQYGPMDAVWSSPSIANDGTVYFLGVVGGVAGVRSLYAVNPDGTLKWQYSGAVDASTEWCPSIGSDGTLYFTTGFSGIYAVTANGTLKWTCLTRSPDSSLAIGADGTIYSLDFDGGVYAVTAGGILKWTDPFTPVSGISSPAIGADGTIYVGNGDAASPEFVAITDEGLVASELWRTPVSAAVGTSSPAIGADGTIYVGCFDGNVYAFNPGGTVKWQYLTGSDVLSSPAIGEDGTVYIGSGDGYLYAFQ